MQLFRVLDHVNYTYSSKAGDQQYISDCLILTQAFHIEVRSIDLNYNLILTKQQLPTTKIMGNNNVTHSSTKTNTISNNNTDNNRILLSEEQSKMFTCIVGKQVVGGSSPSRQFMIHVPSCTVWVGKCSALGIIKQNQDYTPNVQTPTDSINEYKQMLALRLYSFFQVNTPQALLIKLPINQQAKKMLQIPIKQAIAKYSKLKKYIGFQVPRTHILSRFIQQYKPVGSKFVEEYGKIDREFYCVGSGIRLVGFGRALAVATLLYDYDCVGNSGSNIGYVIRNGQADIIKIDAGETLPFVGNLSMAEGVKHNPQSRDMITGTHKTKISFQSLTFQDKREFIQTTRIILATKDDQIEILFKEFIGLDQRFKEILIKLLERKANFLKAFTPQISSLLQEEIQNIDKSEAINIYENWSSSVYVAGLKREVIEEKALLNSYQLVNKNKNYQVPKADNSFIVREQQLIQIESVLKKQRIICICGAGGLGKTELVKQFINKSKYDVKIWLHAEYRFSISQMKTYLNALYPQSKLIKSVYELVDYFYFRLGQNSCVVFDNLQNEDELASLVSKDCKAHIIITSRFKLWKIPKIQLQCFSEQDLLSYAAKSQMAITHQQSRILNNFMDGLPLAISQAFAYLKNNKSLSISDYCKKGQQLMIIGSQNSQIGSSLFTSIVLTLNSAKKRDELTNQVMQIAAFLSADHITQQLLESFSKKKIRGAIDILINYSIFSSENKTIKVHRLTQSVSLMIQQKNQVFEKNLKNIMEWLQPQLLQNQQKRTKQDLERFSSLVPHGLALCKIGKTVKYDQKSLIEIYWKIGRSQIHNNQDATFALQRCLQYGQQCYKQNHPNLGKILVALARAYGIVFNYTKLKETADRSLQITLQYENQDTVLAYSLCGIYLFRFGKYEQGLKAYKNSLLLSEKVYGLNHITTGHILNIVASAQKKQGNFQLELQMYSRALPIYQKQYGSDHFQFLQIFQILNERKQCKQEKIKILEKKLRSYELNLKPNDSRIAKTKTELGFAYKQIGKYEQSRQFFQQSLLMLEEKLGSQHIDLINLLFHLSFVHTRLGEYQKPKKYLNWFWNINSQHFKNQESKGLWNAYRLFGQYYLETGDHRSSIQNYEKAWRIMENIPNLDLFPQKTILLNLGHLYYQQRNYSKVIRVFQALFKLGSLNHQQKFTAYSKLAKIFRCMQNYYYEKIFLVNSSKNRIKLIGPINQQIAYNLLNLSFIEVQLGNLNDAHNFAINSYETFLNLEKTFGLAYPGKIQAFNQIKTIKNLMINQRSNGQIKDDHRCFRRFKDLRKYQQNCVENLLKIRPSKWNYLNDQIKLKMLTKINFTSKNSQRFLEIKFRGYISSLVFKQKHRWDKVSQEQQSDLLKSYKNKNKQTRFNTVDFLCINF